MIILETATHKIETSGRLPNEEEKARAWRDNELAMTDWIYTTGDHPQYDEYIAYRQALRDWPSTEDFPSVKPSI